jgi:hypothetical protein
LLGAVCATVALWTGAFASPVVAQVSSTPAAVPAPNAKSVALVRRFFAATKLDAQVDAMMGAMLPVMLDQQIKRNPALSAVGRDVVLNTARDLMREVVTPKIIEAAIPLYAETFSEPELEQIVAFYESPGGRAITEKQPSLAPKMAEVTRAIIPEAVSEMTRRMCEKLGCGAEAQPAKLNPT